MTLKRIVEISPLILAFLIFNGFLKLYVYYENWNIRISDYLEFSEILLSFLNDLNIIILALVIFIVYALIIKKFLFSKLNPENFIEPIEKNKGLYVFIFLALPTIFGMLFYFTNFLVYLFITIALFFQFVFFVAEYLNEEYESHNLIFSIAITFLSFTYCLAYYDINKTKLSAKKYCITLDMENEKIITTDKFYLVGKSQKYIFLRNEGCHSTRIIPVDKINFLLIAN